MRGRAVHVLAAAVGGARLFGTGCSASRRAADGAPPLLKTLLRQRKSGEHGWSGGGGWRGFSEHARDYEHAQRSYRVRDAIIGANTLVLACITLGEVADAFSRRSGTPQAWWFDLRTILDNCTVSVDQIEKGRYHTLITSSFAHRDAGHYFISMLGLVIFGSDVVDAVGPRGFLALYLAAALAGSAAHCAWQARERRDGRRPQPNVAALGATAAVNALTLFSAVVMPTTRMYRARPHAHGGPVLAAFVLGCSLLVTGLLSAEPRPDRSHMGHAGHAAGAALGLAAGLAFRARLRRAFGPDFGGGWRGVP